MHADTLDEQIEAAARLGHEQGRLPVAAVDFFDWVALRGAVDGSCGFLSGIELEVWFPCFLDPHGMTHIESLLGQRAKDAVGFAFREILLFEMPERDVQVLALTEFTRSIYAGVGQVVDQMMVFFDVNQPAGLGFVSGQKCPDHVIFEEDAMIGVVVSFPSSRAGLDGVGHGWFGIGDGLIGYSLMRKSSGHSAGSPPLGCVHGHVIGPGSMMGLLPSCFTKQGTSCSFPLRSVSPEAFQEGEHVAVLAARRHLSASRPRIKRGTGPFYFRLLAHLPRIIMVAYSMRYTFGASLIFTATLQ